MTVYLVWTGEYSDARVVGIYDDKAHAETLAKGLRYGRVEERTLNEFQDELAAGRTIWHVVFHPKDLDPDVLKEVGTVDAYTTDGVTISTIPFVSWDGVWECRVSADRTLEVHGRADGTSQTYRLNVWAVDKAHAIKVASDRLAAFLAHPTWQTEDAE